MWQISYPLANGVSRGNNFLPKISQTDRETNSLTQYTGYVDFFFQINLLPPYLLRSLGDKTFKSNFTVPLPVKTKARQDLLIKK